MTPEGGGSTRLRGAREWLAVGPRKWVAVGVAVALAAGIGVGVGLLILSAVSSDPPRRPADAPPPGFVRFRDPRVGFSLLYPSSWVRLEARDPDVVLIAAQRGGTASILVRTFPLRFTVNRETLGVGRALSDRVVASDRNVGLLARPTPITLGGLKGFFYFYAFRDERTRQRGIHSHYFVFEDRTMISMVLQSLPAEEFKRLAPLFDRIEGSFRDEAP